MSQPKSRSKHPLPHSNNKSGSGGQKPVKDEHKNVRVNTPCGLGVRTGEENSCNCVTCKKARNSG